MKFTPGRKVVLQTEDGVELRATPFFYTTVVGGGLSVELYAETGARLCVLDAERGVYTLGDTGRILTIKLDAATGSNSNQHCGLDGGNVTLG
jgi:hypothetical protein